MVADARLRVGNIKRQEGRQSTQKKEMEMEPSQVGFLQLSNVQIEVAFTSLALGDTGPSATPMGRGKTCESLLTVLVQATEPPLQSAGTVLCVLKIIASLKIIGLEGIFEGHLVQPACNGQGHLHIDEKSPIPGSYRTQADVPAERTSLPNQLQ